MLVFRRGTLMLLLSLCLTGAVQAQERFITVASTESPQRSGLFDILLPAFTAKTGIAVRVEAVGTGRALDLARQGNADVALVHDRPAEDKFIAEGHGVGRLEVMRDEFILVGPSTDPANLAGTTDLLDAFRRIAATKATFVSRRDSSGTNAAELRFWRAAGTDIGWIKGFWYKEVRDGAIAALSEAAEHDGYTLLDRGTWSGFKDRRNLVVLVEGGQRLLNQYAVVLVNPQKHPNVKAAEARAFANWLLSPECQDAIGRYRVDGEQPFVPSASAGARLEAAWRPTIFADGATP
jgi:tungstate transport system substrate-binding protein